MNKTHFSRIVRGILGVGLVVSYILAVMSVASTQIVPLSYVFAATLVGAIIVIILCIPLFKKKVTKGKGIAASVIALLLIAASLYAVSVSQATNSLLDSLREGEYTYIEYSVIAQEDQQIELAEPGQQMAILETDEHNELVKAEVDELTQPEYRDYRDPISAAASIVDGEADMAVLRSAYVDVVAENNEEFEQNTEVLTTFTIRVAKDTAKAETDITQPFVVYISGIDTDGDIASAARSDVNMLAVVNPQTQQILLVNTPRDYYVQLHGTDGARDKLTHAGIYGVEMSKQTLADLYGVDIDYHVRVNFASLTKLVDALGGVEVYSDQAFDSANYSFSEGYNTVNGDQALEFARTRYAFTDGDRTRGENQQRVIEAIISEVGAPGNVTNIQRIMRSLEGSFQTNASESEITALLNQQANDLGDWNVESISVDGTGTMAPTYSMGSQPLYVMEPNRETVEQAKRAIVEYMQ